MIVLSCAKEGTKLPILVMQVDIYVLDYRVILYTHQRRTDNSLQIAKVTFHSY